MQVTTMKDFCLLTMDMYEFSYISNSNLLPMRGHGVNYLYPLFCAELNPLDSSLSNGK